MEVDMALTITSIVALTALGCFLLALRRRHRRQEASDHSISPEALYQLMKEDKDLLLFDVRVPLDLLAHSEMITGAIRLPPNEVNARANSISKDVDIVIYGTCLDKNTLHLVLQITQNLKFCRLKMLQGGFEGWKNSGFPVEAYTVPFHLDTPTG
jgi:rhodanese-related sulfurtransferase